MLTHGAQIGIDSLQLSVYRIHSKYNTPSNYSTPPLFGTKNISLHIQILHFSHLTLYYLINKTFNMTLKNNEHRF